jgi:acetyl/propionyl-CoA carboxylase alpha subunit
VDDHPELSAIAADPEVRNAHVAAALWARIRRNRAADPHWGFAAPGWRNVPSQPQQVSFDGAVISYQVDGGTLTLTVGDRTTTASLSGGEPFLVEIEGVGRHCAVALHGNTLWVNGSDGQTVFREDPRFTVHDSVLSAGGPTAPVPGTVVAVLVGAGDEVGDGADLLVMEAMKMEHRIKAPGPSHVVEVLVAPGDQVDAGRLLIRLEERAP